VTEAVPVLVFQLAVLTPVFTTLLGVLSERADGARPPLLRMLTAPLRNPIALATAAGITASATGLRPPETVIAPIELISDLAVPGMLLAFGISLCGAKRPGAGETAPLLASVLLLKCVVHPLLALLVGLVLGLEGHALLAVVVCAALPTAQNVFGYAVRFDQGVVLGRDAALSSTVISVPVLFGIVAVLA
jgi:predicted permease